MPRIKAFDREEVLDKAMKLFWDKGYNATSYSDLVEGLGINRQSIYDTFGDKQQLYNAAFDRFRCKSAQRLKDELNKTPSARKQIELLLEMAVADSLKDPENKGCMMVNSTVELAAHDTQVASLACQSMQDWLTFVEPIVAKGQADGEITTRNDAKSITLFIYNTINGLKLISRLGLPKETYDHILKVTRTVLD